MPPEHERPPLQTLLHDPQWFGSLCVFTHAPLHAMRPDPQLSAQAPIEHTCPCGQTLPHMPQFAGLV
jgi:hypothetical protein